MAERRSRSVQGPTSLSIGETSRSLSPLRFLFQVELIEPANTRGGDMIANYLDWLPPNHTNGFVCHENKKTPWYLWRPGAVSVQPTRPDSYPQGSIESNSTTLFWDFRTSRYIGVPINCRTKNVQDMNPGENDDPPGWSTLRYCPIHKEDETLISISFIGPHRGLGAPASRQWMPQFIPSTSALPPGVDAAYEGNAKLVARMSLLVALAVMSCDFDHIVETMRDSFRPPYWRRHPYPSGRMYKRGVVVNVRRFSNAPKLDPWETGSHGPLISGPDDRVLNGEHEPMEEVQH